MNEKERKGKGTRGKGSQGVPVVVNNFRWKWSAQLWSMITFVFCVVSSWLMAVKCQDTVHD
jgi:hypothetical protein